MIAGRYWTFMMAVIGITIGDAAGVIEGGVSAGCAVDAPTARCQERGGFFGLYCLQFQLRFPPSNGNKHKKEKRADKQRRAALMIFFQFYDFVRNPVNVTLHLKAGKKQQQLTNKPGQWQTNGMNEMQICFCGGKWSGVSSHCVTNFICAPINECSGQMTLSR